MMVGTYALQLEMYSEDTCSPLGCYIMQLTTTSRDDVCGTGFQLEITRMFNGAYLQPDK